MICPNCSHENEGGRFCIKCGTPLKREINNEVASTTETIAQSSPAQPNKYIETTKQASKMYFNYFLQVLKQPYSSSRIIGADQFINGLITMIIYSFLIPLISYFTIKGALNSYDPYGLGFGSSLPFSDIVLKPTLAYFIFILLVTAFSFLAIRLGKVNVSFKEVMARFGSLLVPTIALFIITLLVSFIEVRWVVPLLFFGLISSILLVPPLVITSFKKGMKDGIDIIYGSLITYALTFITLYIMGNMLFESLKSNFGDLFGGF